MRQIAFESIPWGQEEREAIMLLIVGQGDTRTMSQAGFLLGDRFAEAALYVVEKSGFDIEDIDLVGSHGQTVWHEVEEDGTVQSTLQIGEAAVIAERTGLTTVADFRVADVAAGGQGAPLIPIFDRFFLRPKAGSTGCRAVQNIGGIGNVTFLPPEGRSGGILAYDTGPGNVLIDWAAGQTTDGALQFDKDGGLAARAVATIVWLKAGLHIPISYSLLPSRQVGSFSAMRWPNSTVRRPPTRGSRTKILSRP